MLDCHWAAPAQLGSGTPAQLRQASELWLPRFAELHGAECLAGFKEYAHAVLGRAPDSKRDGEALGEHMTSLPGMWTAFWRPLAAGGTGAELARTFAPLQGAAAMASAVERFGRARVLFGDVVALDRRTRIATVREAFGGALRIGSKKSRVASPGFHLARLLRFRDGSGTSASIPFVPPFIRPIASVLFLVLASACSSQTTTTSAAPSPPEPGDDAGAPPPPEGGPGDGGAEAGPSNPAGSIGDYSEKGLAFLDVSPVKPTSCGAFCTSKGGTCLPALAVQDSTAAAAGSAMYYAPSSSLQVPRLLATCAEVATETYLADVYAPYTPVLGSLTCSCTDVPVAPRVTVEAPVTVSCAAVCKSWKKTCEPTRAWEIGFEPSGGIALYKTGDAASLGCADVPPASKSGSALDAVICACK